MTGIDATYRDNLGRLRAAPGVFPALLADFLETDVRENPERCEALLADLARAREGTPFEAYGNLYVLGGGAGGAVIENAYDATVPPLRLSLADLERALSAWRAALE